jgi:tetratricopeptide (TPR) repeat protein
MAMKLMLERPGEAIDPLERAVQLAHAASNQKLEASALVNLGSALGSSGSRARAREVLQRAVRLCNQFGRISPTCALRWRICAKPKPLCQGEHDKAGHRGRAVERINRAIAEVEAGIAVGRY